VGVVTCKEVEVQMRDERATPSPLRGHYTHYKERGQRIGL